MPTRAKYRANEKVKKPHPTRKARAVGKQAHEDAHAFAKERNQFGLQNADLMAGELSPERKKAMDIEVMHRLSKKKPKKRKK